MLNNGWSPRYLTDKSIPSSITSSSVVRRPVQGMEDLNHGLPYKNSISTQLVPASSSPPGIRGHCNRRPWPQQQGCDLRCLSQPKAKGGYAPSICFHPASLRVPGCSYALAWGGTSPLADNYAKAGIKTSELPSSYGLVTCPGNFWSFRVTPRKPINAASSRPTKRRRGSRWCYRVGNEGSSATSKPTTRLHRLNGVSRTEATRLAVRSRCSDMPVLHHALALTFQQNKDSDSTEELGTSSHQKPSAPFIIFDDQ